MSITETTTTMRLLSIFVKKSLNIHLPPEQSANENLNVPQVNNKVKKMAKKAEVERNSNDFWVSLNFN